MKKFLIATFVACVAVAVPAASWATDDNHDKPDEHTAQPAQHAPAASPRTGGHVQDHAVTQRQGSNRTQDHIATQPQGTARHAANVQSTSPSRHHRTTTGANTGGGRTTTRNHVTVDVTSYHKNVTAERQYHFGNYNAPQGYAYHHYDYGDRLPQGYYGQNYWIANFLNFGLISPPDGYVWVRYGPDAVLIDEDTGEIAQIVYDQFY